MSKKNRIRLFIDQPLQPGSCVTCSADQAHYLLTVMRVTQGDTIYIFNGRQGEFAATVSACQKKNCVLEVGEKFADFFAAPDIWLLFPPLKKDNTDLIIEKAVELGAAKILPVVTEYTSVAKIKTERLKLQIIEAAEQCRRQDIPQLSELQKLSTVLQNWPQDRTLFYFDETGCGRDLRTVFTNFQGAAGLLIGPEGGFSEKELEILRNLDYTQGISLGKRILRTETAAVSALACWQALCGDWR